MFCTMDDERLYYTHQDRNDLVRSIRKIEKIEAVD